MVHVLLFSLQAVKKPHGASSSLMHLTPCIPPTDGRPVKERAKQRRREKQRIIHRDGCTHGRMHGWMDIWTDEMMDGSMDR